MIVFPKFALDKGHSFWEKAPASSRDCLRRLARVNHNGSCEYGRWELSEELGQQNRQIRNRVG